MVNKVILIGNLGRDPEVRSTPSGQPVATFSIATTRKWKDRNSGQLQEQTEWHNIVCWGRQAEIAGQYLTKGKKIYVEGRLQTRNWEDKETGKKMYRTEVVCDNFQMLGGRGESGGGGGFGGGQGGGYGGGQGSGQGGGQGGGTSSGSNYGDPGFEPEDDDIPF